MRHSHLLLLLCLLSAFTACRQTIPSPPPCDFETGDLIFIHDTAGMGHAIQSATAWDSLQPAFTHVAITQCTDSGVYVFDATPSLGVAERFLPLILRHQQ